MFIGIRCLFQDFLFADNAFSVCGLVFRCPDLEGGHCYVVRQSESLEVDGQPKAYDSLEFGHTVSQHFPGAWREAEFVSIAISRVRAWRLMLWCF